MLRTTRKRRSAGIAASEYLIILLVVAVSSIALFNRFGATIQSKITAANADVAAMYDGDSPFDPGYTASNRGPGKM
jgi:hypothetical protein